jgi:integrase
MRPWLEHSRGGYRVRWRDYFGEKKSSPLFSTEVQGRRFAEMIVHQLAEQVGLSGPLSSTATLGEAFEIFTATQPWTDRTRSHLQRKLRAGFISHFGGQSLASLRPLDLGLYLVGRRAVLSPASYHCEEGIIKRFFRWAEANMYIAVDPARDFHSPRPTSLKHFCLSWAQERRVLDVVRTLKATSQARYFLCRDTGMRVSNAMGLRRSQLDFKARTVSFLCLKSQVQLTLPWTERLAQCLQMFQPLAAASWLFECRAIQQGREYTSGADLFIRISRKAGFKSTNHDLRHTFFTRFYEATQDHFLANYVVGHSMSNHVDVTYWHPPSPEGLREAFQKFEAYQKEKLRQAEPQLSPAEMWKELQAPHERQES